MTPTLESSSLLYSSPINTPTLRRGQYISVQSTYGRDNTDQVRLTLGIKQHKLLKQLFNTKSKTEFINILTHMIQLIIGTARLMEHADGTVLRKSSIEQLLADSLTYILSKVFRRLQRYLRILDKSLLTVVLKDLQASNE